MWPPINPEHVEFQLHPIQETNGLRKWLRCRIYHKQLALLEDLQRGLHAGLGRHLPKPNATTSAVANKEALHHGGSTSQHGHDAA